MSVRKTYTRDVDLPSTWDWQVVMGLNAVLTPRVQLIPESSRLATVDGQNAAAETLNDLADEYPNAQDVNELTITYEGQSGMRLYVWFTHGSWGRSWASVSGDDEAEVLGIAAIVNRFAEREREKAQAEAAARAKAEEAARSIPDTGPVTQSGHDHSISPVWQQAWFWGAIGAAVTVIGIVVEVLRST
jgi:hypothetical protein